MKFAPEQNIRIRLRERVCRTAVQFDHTSMVAAVDASNCSFTCSVGKRSAIFATVTMAADCFIRSRRLAIG